MPAETDPAYPKRIADVLKEFQMGKGFKADRQAANAPQSEPLVPVYRCETCRFWQRKENPFGRCQLNPPIYVRALTDEGETVPTFSFPVTESTDQCRFHEELALSDREVRPE